MHPPNSRVRGRRGTWTSIKWTARPNNARSLARKQSKRALSRSVPISAFPPSLASPLKSVIWVGAPELGERPVGFLVPSLPAHSAMPCSHCSGDEWANLPRAPATAGAASGAREARRRDAWGVGARLRRPGVCALGFPHSAHRVLAGRRVRRSGWRRLRRGGSPLGFLKVGLRRSVTLLLCRRRLRIGGVQLALGPGLRRRRERLRFGGSLRRGRLLLARRRR